ncbi:MAG: Flagellar M-ring protein [Pseudonocardiales bacterium]|nr:Flagellar M-ring protein [Pseudonocardiales bacterium]
MKEQLLSLGRRAWNDFRAFSAGQKAVTVVAGIALIVGGVLFATWTSKPSYAPLYTNLAATDASAIVDKLNSAKIPYQLGAAGTEILVPKDKVYSTRLTISAAGLPASSQTGYSLLDKEGVTTSEFKQQVDYQRAIEGELGKTIQTINGVTAASVHLAIPQQNVFNDGTQKPTAAVLLSTAAGTHLTSQQVQSVVYLVSSSVPSMDANSVTVTDSNGAVLAAPGSGVTDAAGTSTQTQATQDYNAALAGKLQNLINATVGAGHSIVTVNSVLDFNKTSTTRNSYVYDPKAPPLSKQSTTEKYTGNQAGSGGTLGTGTPATTGSAATGAGSYTKNNSTVDNALGTTTQTTQNAPGSVQKQAIAVLLDGSVKNVNVNAIDTLVRSAVGLDPKRGDTLAIQAMPFDTSQATAAAAAAASAAKAAAAKAAHDHLMSLVRQGLLGAAVLAVVLGTWLASRRRRRASELPFVNDDLFGSEPIDFAPPAEPEHLAVVVEFQEAAARRRALVALADEQPRDVARVLSGWLNTKEG